MNFRRLVSAVAALAVAGTCVVTSGVSVLADEETTSTIYYSQDYDDATEVDWVSPNLQAMFSLVSDANNGLMLQADHDAPYVAGTVTQRQNSRGAYLFFDTSLAAGSEYALEFDLSMDDGWYPNQNSEFAVMGADYKYSINDGMTSGYALKLTGTASSTTLAIEGLDDTLLYDGTMYHYLLVVSGTTAYLTVTSDDDTIVDGQRITVDGSGGVAGLYYRSGRYTSIMEIDNIVLREPKDGEIPTTTTYTITTHYITDDSDASTVVADKTATVDAGDSYVPTYDTVIYDGAYKYSYSSHTTIAEVTADADVYVYYTKSDRDVYTATITSTGVEADDITEDFYEGATTTLYYPRYILDGTTIYEANTQSSSYKYGHTFSTTETIEVTYTKAYENAVYFEDLDDDYSTNVYGSTYGSNGKVRNNASWETTSELEAGTYQIYVMACDRDRGSLIKVGDTTIFDIDTSGIKDNNGYWGLLTATFTIEEASTVSLELGDGKSTYDPIDTIIITQSPEIMSVDVTSATATESDPEPTALTGVGVRDKTLTGSEAVTTYLIKVANYTETLGNPTIYTETEGATELTPKGEVTYGYSSGGYKYFVIQTIGIGDATKVALDSCTDYTDFNTTATE